MMQIDSSSKPEEGPAGQGPDRQNLYYEEMVQEFMGNENVVKRMRNLLGRSSRLSLNVDELREFNPQLANFVIKNPLQAIKMFEDNLNHQMKGLQDESAGKTGGQKEAQADENAYFPKKVTVYHVSFDGNFGANYVTPRGLRSNLMNQMVTVQGIVTRMSMVHPKLQTAVQYCEATKKGSVRNLGDNQDLSSLAEENKMEEGKTFQNRDMNDNPLTTEYGFCVFKDYQVVTIQEMPERAPAGQLPRSVQVILQNDLVDSVKPGDRIEVTGVFRCETPQSNSTTTGVFRPELIAVGIQNILFEKEKPAMSENDIKNIKKVSKEKDLFDLMGKSVANTIEGHLNVKKAILLLLLGGAEKNLESGTHLRGDVNIMMVGDPSTAKSQLLRHVMDIAPLAINTTGRGSTGVGLTAAVCIDKDTGEKHLEAGAMVLADKGVVCIDEFDKMNDIDRVAIHEVMEQQTVTIAKAGMHVSLNARCSVIAAANPMYGEYARDQSVARNIALPDSLLSRFDLLFIMLDEKDAEGDRKIAEKVIQNHRCQTGDAHHFNYLNDEVVVEREMVEENGAETSIYNKTGGKKGKNDNSLTRDFLKKYISFAKAQKAPEITQDLVEYAAQLYNALRQKAQGWDANRIAIPITVRTLESIIRLATAHAKLRLSKTVEPDDIDAGAQLLMQCIFQEDEKQKKKGAKEYEGEDDDENMWDEEDEVVKKHQSQSRAQRMAEKELKSLDYVSPKAKQEREEAKESGRRKTRENSKSATPKSTDHSAKSSSSGTPQKNNSSSKKVAFADSKKDASEAKSNKKRRVIDEEEQVSTLFQEPAARECSVALKRFVFKLVNDLKDKHSKAFIDQLWKKYMTMPEKETVLKGSQDPMVDSKSHLVEVIESLERDNLVMFNKDDGAIIMI